MVASFWENPAGLYLMAFLQQKPENALLSELLRKLKEVLSELFSAYYHIGIKDFVSSLFLFPL